MKKLIRPKNVQRGQKNYLTNEQFQDYAEQQLSNVCDYVDRDILFDDDSNLKTTINLAQNLNQYDSIEVWYRTDREGRVLKGSQKLQNPVGACLCVNNLFRVSSSVQKGTTALYEIGNNQISLIAGSGYEVNHDEHTIINSVCYTYITRVLGNKGKE